LEVCSDAQQVFGQLGDGLNLIWMRARRKRRRFYDREVHQEKWKILRVARLALGKSKTRCSEKGIDSLQFAVKSSP